MPPTKEEIRPALEMLPQQILRKIIEERGIGFKSRYTEELIERILEDDWTDAELEELKQRVATVEREKTPKSRYFANIDTISSGLGESEGMERVRDVLETNEAVFVGDELDEEGFEITETSDTTLSGTHWTRSINYVLTPWNEIEAESELYKTTFTFDFEREVLSIDSTLPAKARSLRTELERLGIETSEVGHTDLPNDKANRLVQRFIDDIEQELLERRSQTTLDDRDPEVIEVDLVNMLVDDIELEDVRIGGRTNIIKHPQVKKITKKYDSQIFRFEGTFELDNVWYEFRAGQTDGMGQVSVRKQGSIEERPDLVDKGFNFLYEYFEEYFIEVS